MLVKYTLLAVIVIGSLSCAGGNSSGNPDAANTVSSSSNEEISQDNSAGKQLFMSNCASCHHVTRDLTGPAMYGVRSRWKDQKLLREFVRNSTAVIKKDKYAKELYEKWNKTQMNLFPKLTDAEIDSIFDYVDAEAKKKGIAVP
jgi:mono/diheme cytochrome c family protein